MKNVSFCPRPFEEIEISITGEVYTCCPNWNNFYSIGNIHKDTLENIWNSKNAIDVRKRILNNDYSICDINRCLYLKQNDFKTAYETNYKAVMNEYPKTVKFVYDKECNIDCKICRDKITRLTENELEVLNSKIDTFFLPILRSAKILIINAAGDPFGSRHSRLLIKQAAQTYPDLKFDIHTNGILCNEENLKKLNVTPDRISIIRISIHAATPQTYGKIVTNGEFYFPKIISNLKYLSTLKSKYEFPIFIQFVILPDNYKEIPSFIRLAEQLNVLPTFWEYRRENCAYENKEHLFIYQKKHPLYTDLVKVLQHPKVKQYKRFFSPLFFDLIES